MNQNYLKLQCPECGAPMEIEEEHRASCPSCGQKYIINEAGGLVVNMDVDYGDGKDTKNSITATLIVMGFVLGIVFIVLIAVFSANYEAINSRLFSSDYDLLGREKAPVTIFCEDVFDKEYKEITEEEFASIRYIKYDNDRLPGTGENVHIIEYSFTDYQDCESEEEFQATIKRWTCQHAFTKEHEMNFNMLTGLTRVAIGGHSHLIKEDAFSKEADIRYVTTSSETDGEQYISKRVDPNKIEVLEFKAWGDLEGIEVFPNLRELNIELWFGTEFDFTKIENCKNLEKLVVTDRADNYIGLDKIGELTQLKSLSLENMYLDECSFISKLSNLEELTIRVNGENPQIKTIGNLSNLKYLYLYKGYIPAEDIHWFEGVEVLELAINDLDAVEKLAKVESLRVLDVYMEVPYDDTEPRDPWDYDGILDMSPLASLPDLEYLYIQQEPDFYSNKLYVYGLESVLSHPKLKGVYINEQLHPYETGLIGEEIICRIDTDLLEDNEQLKCLQFRDCIFEDIKTESVIKPDFVYHYTNLEYLVMDECGVTDISFVERMPNLKYCSFAHNELKDFTSLNQCKFLEVVALYGNADAEPVLSGEVVIIGGSEGVNLTEYLSGIE